MTCNSYPWCYVQEEDVYKNRCILYNGLTRQPWLTEYKKMINPLGWKYYIETIDRQQQQEEKVASPEASQEAQNDQLIDMTDSQLIQLAEDMLENVDPLQGNAGATAMDTASACSSENDDGSTNEQTQDTAAGQFSYHGNGYHDDGNHDNQTTEYELIELQSSLETGEMDEMYHVPQSICKHDILTLNEGFFECVKCDTEM